MTEPKGTHGGARPGAGNPNFRPKWNAGETRTIRVPAALVDEVMDYARKLDEQYPNPLKDDSVSQSIDAAALLNQLKPLLGKGSKLTLAKLEDILSELLPVNTAAKLVDDAYANLSGHTDEEAWFMALRGVAQQLGYQLYQELAGGYFICLKDAIAKRVFAAKSLNSIAGWLREQPLN